MDDEQLTEIVSFRLTPSELEEVDRLARDDQRRRADWLRLRTREAVDRLTARARIEPEPFTES